MSFSARRRPNGERSTRWVRCPSRSRPRSASAVAGNAEAAELGITPDTSMVGGYLMGDETIFHGNYRAWLHLLKRGLEKR